MDSIEKYIEDLKSPNVNRRFDACYYLRLMKEIPERAILALQEATNDPDHLVAKEAKKALQAHNVLIEANGNESKRDGESKDSNSAPKNFLIGYGWIIFIGFLMSVFLFGEGLGLLLAFAIGPILFLIIVVGVIGYFVSSSSSNSSVKDTDKNGEKTEDLSRNEMNH